MARLPHPRLPRDEHFRNLRDRFRKAYPDPVQVKETTPQAGGVRSGDVQKLVEEGFAEWVQIGASARMKAPVEKVRGSINQDRRHQNGLD